MQHLNFKKRYVIPILWMITAVLVAGAVAFFHIDDTISFYLPAHQSLRYGTTWPPHKESTIPLSKPDNSGAAVVYTRVSRSILGSIAWSPAGKFLATAGPKEWETNLDEPEDGSYDYPVEVRSWPDLSQIRLLRGHTSWIMSVAWSPDGRWLAASSEDDRVLIWDAKTGQVKATLGGYSALAWSPDSSRIVVGGMDGRADVYNVGTGALQASIDVAGPDGYVSANAWSPDGKHIVSASSFTGQVIVWNAAAGQVESTLQTGADQIWAAAWSPNGKLIATGSEGQKAGGLQVWQMEGKKWTVKDEYGGNQHIGSDLPFVGIQTLAWSPDSRRLAGGNAAGQTWVMKPGDLETWHRYDGHEAVGISSAVTDVAWSPDGPFLATTGEDDTVQIWSPPQP